MMNTANRKAAAEYMTDRLRFHCEQANHIAPPFDSLTPKDIGERVRIMAFTDHDHTAEDARAIGYTARLRVMRDRNQIAMYQTA